MKIAFLAFILILLFPISGRSQAWQQVGLQHSGSVADLVKFNGELYVIGDFVNTAGNSVKGLAKWSGTDWEPVCAGMLGSNGTDGYATCMEVYNNELYVGGNFAFVDGNIPATRIAKWSGTSWSAVGTGLTMMGVPHDFEVLGGKLYITGGAMATCNTPSINIVYWHGVDFQTVGSGELSHPSGASFGYGHSLTTHDGELYVAGLFLSIDGINSQTGIAHWDGTNWVSVPGGLPHPQGSDIASINGYLTVALGNEQLFRLLGGQWEDVMQGYLMPGVTNSMVSFNGVHVIAGSYNSEPIYQPGAWQGMGNLGVSHFQNLKIIDDELYVMGRESIGGGAYNTIVARWDGPLAVGKLEGTAVRVYPNPAVDVLHIDGISTGAQKITMINSTGDLIGAWNYTPEINVQNLPVGVYFLELIWEDGVEHVKFTKSN